MDRIAVVQRGPLDAQIVDESAVQAVEIFHDQARAFVVDAAWWLETARLSTGMSLSGDRPIVTGRLPMALLRRFYLRT